MTIADESREEFPKQEFTLVKRCYDEVWFAHRVSDGKQFIARKITEFDSYLGAVAEGAVLDEQALEDRGVIELLFHHSQARSLSMLLNHENLVSIAGTIRMTPPKAPKSKMDEYVVWDFCDAGTLSHVLQDTSIEKKPGYWLPESLCWHVLKSMMRALAWLHTGTRRYFDEWNGMMWPEQRDLDWHPILHRNINPANIYFQHPSGTETYGLCKLGNLQNAFVSGKYGGKVDPWEWVKPNDPKRPVSVAMQSGVHSLKKLRDKLKGSPLDQPPDQRIYTTNQELWNLGTLVYTMMTGLRLPDFLGCPKCDHKCYHLHYCKLDLEPGGCRLSNARKRGCHCILGNCSHIKEAVACTHDALNDAKFNKCKTPAVNFHETLLLTDYSQFLIRAVLSIMEIPAHTGRIRTSRDTLRKMEDVEMLYKSWKEMTDDGKEYVDIDDDMDKRFASHQYVPGFTEDDVERWDDDLRGSSQLGSSSESASDEEEEEMSEEV